jgi:hypothetical protein
MNEDLIEEYNGFIEKADVRLRLWQDRINESIDRLAATKRKGVIVLEVERIRDCYDQISKDEEHKKACIARRDSLRERSVQR